MPFKSVTNHSASDDGWSSNMKNHSWDCLEELSFNIMKLVHVIVSLADGLATICTTKSVHRCKPSNWREWFGLFFMSRLAVPGGCDLLNQGKLESHFLGPSDTG